MEQMLWDRRAPSAARRTRPSSRTTFCPLVFIKRLSDVFDDEVKRLVETYGDAETARTVLEADHSLVRFYLPPECRWPVVSRREPFKWPKDKTPKTLGEQLTMTVRAIAKANAAKLSASLTSWITTPRRTANARSATRRCPASSKRCPTRATVSVCATWSRISWAAPTNTCSANSPRARAERRRIFHAAGSRLAHRLHRPPASGRGGLRFRLRLGRSAHQMRTRPDSA